MIEKTGRMMPKILSNIVVPCNSREFGCQPACGARLNERAIASCYRRACRSYDAESEGPSRAFRARSLGTKYRARRRQQVAARGKSNAARETLSRSKDILGEIVVARDPGQTVVDERSVDRDRFAGAARGVERHVLEQPFHHRIEPARADVLLALVDGERDLRDPAYP